MTNTKTHTDSRTKTNTRMDFIVNHFRSALKRLTNYDDNEISEILWGIENEEISSLDFIGFIPKSDKNEVCVRLQLSVDWDEHHRLKKETPTVIYESKFDEGNSPEIYGMIIMTQNTIEKSPLIVLCS